MDEKREQIKRLMGTLLQVRDKKLQHDERVEGIEAKLERSGKAKQMGLEYYNEAAPWLVNGYQKEVGRNIRKFKHQTTTNSKNHVHNQHGDPVVEQARRQKAITNTDYNKIPTVTDDPDRACIGALDKDGNEFVLYSKKMPDGTIVYVENVLDSQNNAGLRLKTMYNKIDDVDEAEFIDIAKNKGKNNVTRAKIIDRLIGTGGNPSFEPINKPAVVTTSTSPTNDQLNTNIPQTPHKVNGDDGHNFNNTNRINTLLGENKQRKRSNYAGLT